MSNPKKSGGFSYIEMLIALALLFIALAPIFSAITQAGRNIKYGRNVYTCQLQANSIMLIVRDSLASGVPVQPQIEEYMENNHSNPPSYGYWVFGAGISYVSADIIDIKTEADINGLHESNEALSLSAVYVLVWDDTGRIAGRAAGMASFAYEN